MSPKHDVYDKKGVYAFSSYNSLEFPEVEDIKYLILEKHAQLKDVMCTVMLGINGLLINQKTKRILDKFNLPPHKYYTAYVKNYQGNVYQYFWLQTNRDRDKSKFINYPKTQFYINKDIMGITKEQIDVDSIDDIEKYRKQIDPMLGQAINISKAVLNKEFSKLDIDLLKINRLSIDWIVSKRLKNAFEKAQISGIAFKDAENIKVL